VSAAFGVLPAGAAGSSSSIESPPGFPPGLPAGLPVGLAVGGFGFGFCAEACELMSDSDSNVVPDAMRSLRKLLPKIE
jgi:hypothetical protein